MGRVKEERQNKSRGCERERETEKEREEDLTSVITTS